MWKAVPENRIEKSYAEAKAVYAELFGIDTDSAIRKALDIAVSLHCW